MERDFSVGQANELTQAGRFYDLHNSYDFGGLTIAPGREIRLSFEPNSEFGVGLRALVLTVRGVDFFDLSAGFGAHNVRDIEEVGYKNPGDLDMDWLLSERQATEGDHMVFRFGDEDYLRIHGDRMELEEMVM